MGTDKMFNDDDLGFLVILDGCIFMCLKFQCFHYWRLQQLEIA